MVFLFSYLGLIIVLGLGFLYLQQIGFSMAIQLANTKIIFSPVTAFIAILIAITLLYVLYLLIRSIVRAPGSFVKNRKRKHNEKYLALMTGALTAYLTEDRVKIKELFDKLSLISDKKTSPKLEQLHQNFFPLLAAKNAHLNGDERESIETYVDMVDSPVAEKQLLGLYQLYQKAKKTGAYDACLTYSEQAFGLSKNLKWANDTLLSAAIEDGDWKKAQDLIDIENKSLTRSQRREEPFKEKQAYLYAAQAQDLFFLDRNRALDLMGKAYDLQPKHLGIIALYCVLLMHNDEEKKARKIIDKAWLELPHPDLAKIYIYGGKEHNFDEQLKFADELEKLNSHSVYSYLAKAELYYKNGEYSKARNFCIKAIECEPIARAYKLRKEIEQKLGSHEQMVDEWQNMIETSYDYGWQGDGRVLNSWQVLSPRSKQLGGVSWQKIESEYGRAKNEAIISDYVHSLPKRIKAVKHLNVDNPGVEKKAIEDVI